MFFIKGKGYTGYIQSLPEIQNRIIQFNPDIIHAHGGHIGLLCCLQRMKPVVVTFHGSDINIVKNRLMSSLASCFCAASIFVSTKLAAKSFSWKRSAFVIPCGVDFDVFFPMEKALAKKKLGMDPGERYILFGSSFDNPVKNFPLARKAFTFHAGLPVKEIKGKTREEVNLLLNGAELLLMTSFTEGSPLIIKEAMACNCPIVATDVGDVRQTIGGTSGCYITSFDPEDVASKIQLALDFGKRTDGRGKIGWLDNRHIAQQIEKVYKSVFA